jgi:hypothetical protein
MAHNTQTCIKWQDSSQKTRYIQPKKALSFNRPAMGMLDKKQALCYGQWEPPSKKKDIS